MTSSVNVMCEYVTKPKFKYQKLVCTYLRTHFSEQKGEFLIAYSGHPSILHFVLDCKVLSELR